MIAGRHLVATLLLSLLAPAASFAATAPATMPASPAISDDGELDQRTVNREIEQFRAAKVSLTQAMATAEALHPGSRTADISFDGAAAPPAYRVKTIHDDRLWQHTIDAQTGEVVGTGTTSTLDGLNMEDRSNLAALRTVRHGLPDAVRVAERTTSGKAISGGLLRERGRLNFVIVVLAGSDLKEVILEPPAARSR